MKEERLGYLNISKGLDLIIQINSFRIENILEYGH
jgi:hypothetical protein